MKQVFFVVGFEFGLVAGQKGPIRIVYQVEMTVGAFQSIGEGIQQFEGLNAVIENPLTALLIDIVRQITWHGCDDVDLIFQKKWSHPFITGLDENGEVAPVNNGSVRQDVAQTQDKVLKIGNHLRRATGQIDTRNRMLCNPIQNAIHGLAGNDFPSSWTGIDVTMRAGEVAEFADIDLKHAQPGSIQGAATCCDARKKCICGCHFRLARRCE